MISAFPEHRYAERMLPLAVIVFALLLHAQIGLRDIDAISYIEGARSLRAGHGYVSIAGVPLNHWPVAYSAILSLFPEPLFGALIVNLLSLGACVVLVIRVAARAGWLRGDRVLLGSILGFGFLYDLASVAKPDIICYAGFLGSVLCYGGDRRWRIAGLAVAAALVPFKMIAVTFAPALLFADLATLRLGKFVRERWVEVLYGFAFWCLCLGLVMVHNYSSLGAVTVKSVSDSSFTAFANEILRFCTSFFRNGVVIWYGSLRGAEILIPVGVVLVIGCGCLTTLRRHSAGGAMWLLGFVVLGLSWALELYGVYDAAPRLMGYGMILVLLGLRPVPRVRWLWLTYACAVIALTAYNRIDKTDLGLNHPMYVDAANEVRNAISSKTDVVYTNTFRLLDTLEGIASREVADFDRVPRGALYWHSSLPKPDVMIQPGGSSPLPEWPVVSILSTGTLYRRP
jgi:hypothetical protein